MPTPPAVVEAGTPANSSSSWSQLNTELDALLASSSTALLKSQGLRSTCDALGDLAPTKPLDTEAVAAAKCSLKFAQLLSKLLAARKRARDWKQPEYCERVTDALTASSKLLRAPWLYSNASAAAAARLSARLLEKTELMSRAAAAQADLTKLLGAGLQQPQQPQLVLAAYTLLLWWLDAQALWLQNPARRGCATASSPADAAAWPGYHMHAVELAAALAHTPVQCGAPAAFEQAKLVVAGQVFFRVIALQPQSTMPPALQETCVAQYTSTSYLQLCLAMLLQHVHRHSKQLAELTRSSSSSSSSSAGGSLAQGAAADATEPPAAAAAAAAADGGSSPQSQLQVQPPSQWELGQTLQLSASACQLWRLLGLSPADLPTAGQLLTASGTSLREGGAVRCRIDTSNSMSINRRVYVPLPPQTPPALQVLHLLLSELCVGLVCTLKDQATQALHGQLLEPSRSLGSLSRQQQQLLQAVCWQLPAYLLRCALLCGAGEPLLVEAAATAARWGLECWHVPGMQEAAAAAGPVVKPAQLLPAVLDCWLSLMLQQLVQQPEDIPVAAGSEAASQAAILQAAADRTGHQQQQQRQQQRPAGLLLQVAASLRHVQPGSSEAAQLLRAGTCSCMAAGDPQRGDGWDHGLTCSSSSSSSCVTLDCRSLEAVQSLLACLSAAQVEGDGWVDRGGSVLLLLESLIRRVLPHHITCSSSDSSSSSSNSTNSTSAADQLCIAFGTCLVGHPPGTGLLWRLLTASLRRPQLQPRVLALITSLHKLWDSQHAATTLHHQREEALMKAVHTGMVATLVAVARAPPAQASSWLMVVARYWCRVGRWLELWCRAQQQRLSQQRFSSTGGIACALYQLQCLSGVTAGIHMLLTRIDAAPHLWECGLASSWGVDREHDGGGSSSSSSASGGSSSGSGSSSSRSASKAGSHSRRQDAAASVDQGQQQQQQQQQQWWQQGVWEPWAAGGADTPEADLLTACSRLHLQQQQQQQCQGAAEPGSAAVEYAQLVAALEGLADACGNVVAAADKRLHAIKPFADPATGVIAGSSSSSSSSQGQGSGQACDQTYQECLSSIQAATSVAAVMQACLDYQGLSGLADGLQLLGTMLSAERPVPWACNNPGCASMAGASELQLVGGRACVCGGCGVARYCGRACQAAHWKEHMPFCRALAEAEGAATGVGAGQGGTG